MPGICGAIDRANMPDLGAMVHRMMHHPWYVVNQYTDPGEGVALGQVGLGFTDATEQPVFNEDRSLVIVTTGEIYDQVEQRRVLEKQGRTFRTDGFGELVLHGFESGGHEFLRGLHGAFGAALWDARRRRLVLINDRFGLKPIYYVHRPGRLVFASEIKALLVDSQVSRRLNLRGVAQFFTFGQLLAEDTLLEAVRLLPAATCLTYDAGQDRVTLERYWRLTAGPGPGPVVEADALDRLTHTFQHAVDRQTSGTHNLGISLSGGLDSRTILAAIETDCVPVTAVSMGMAGGIDHASAARMAALVGCRHQACLLDAQFLDQFEQHMRRMVHLTDGHYLSQCVIMPTLPVYRELGIEVLLRGHAGELLHMDKAYNFSLDRAALALRDEAGLEDWLYRHLRTYMMDAVDGPLFAPGLHGQIEALARESLRDCLRETEATQPLLHRIWHLFFAQRTRRETAQSLVKFGSVVETRLPYLDNELIDALLSLPPTWKIGDRLQAHILRRLRPAFLNVPNANTGTRVGAGKLWRFLSKTRLRVLAKLGARGYQPYERLGLWLRRELAPLVRQTLLTPRCLDRGLWNPAMVRAIVDQHLSGQRNHTFLLLALMIFEVGDAQRTTSNPA